MSRIVVVLVVLSIHSILPISPVWAQDFPSRIVRMVVPYAAGGLPDVVTRLVSQRMAESMGQQIIVENRPGAGGIGATEIVVKSPADGYTLLVTDGSQLTINPFIYSKLSYEPMRDLMAVSLMGSSPLFLAVNSTQMSARNLIEMIAFAKANPGKLNYGTPGTGSVVHLAAEAFKAAAGIDLVHIPFKGSAAAVRALLSGDISFAPVALSTVAAHVAAGKVRLLAVTTPTRSRQAPDVPTFGEFGFADFDFRPQVGIVAPAGTPVPIVARLSAEIAKGVKHPETVKRLTSFSIDPVGSTPEAFAAILKADSERYARVVKISGTRAD